METVPYQTPPPAPFVSRRQRGFVDYDRRKVTYCDCVVHLLDSEENEQGLDEEGCSVGE